jgi:hypothetical protein
MHRRKGQNAACLLGRTASCALLAFGNLEGQLSVSGLGTQHQRLDLLGLSHYGSTISDKVLLTVEDSHRSDSTVVDRQEMKVY